MKLLKTFGNQEFILQDEEVDSIVAIKNSDRKAFLKLRCGAFVDTSAIESISEIPLVPFSREGYPLSKDGRSFMRNGDRVWVDDFDGIQYLPDPKYEKIGNVQMKRLNSGNEKMIQ